MKKHSRAAGHAAAMVALALIAHTATAQDSGSSAQIYGVMDAGVEVGTTGAPGARSLTQLNTGNQAANRFGIRVSEDLGGGLRAIANVEAAFAADTGASLTLGEPAGTFFARRSIVGLQGGFGELTLGRDYVPGFWTLVQTDRFRYGLPGTVSTPSQITITRANNGIFYNTPSFGGFIGKFGYTLGAESAAVKDLGRVTSVSVEYKQGGLFASLAATTRKDLVPGSTTATTSFKESGGGIEYAFAPFTVNLGFWNTDPVTATADAIDKSRAVWIGAGYTIGRGQINFQMARTRMDVVGRGEGDALTYGISYTYTLSRSTFLYAAHGRVSNDANVRLPLNTGSQRTGGAVFGADPRAFLVGMRKVF